MTQPHQDAQPQPPPPALSVAALIGADQAQQAGASTRAVIMAAVWKARRFAVHPLALDVVHGLPGRRRLSLARAQARSASEMRPDYHKRTRAASRARAGDARNSQPHHPC